MGGSSRATRRPDDFGPLPRGPPNRRPTQTSAPDPLTADTEREPTGDSTPSSRAGRTNPRLDGRALARTPPLEAGRRDPRQRSDGCLAVFDDLPAPPFSDTTARST
jgi:hypothetical protein